MLRSLQLFAHSLSKQEMNCNIPMSQSLTLRVEASVNALTCSVSALIDSSTIETFARRLSGTAPEAGASTASQCCQWTTFGLRAHHFTPDIIYIYIALILGMPWLKKHNPHINWHLRTVNLWSPNCLSSCFQVPLQSTTIESPFSPSLHNIPPEYQDLQMVFSKSKVTCLPPYRPWDCTIDILPGATPRRRKIYLLSTAKTKAMEMYIAKALKQGFICPSYTFCA